MKFDDEALKEAAVLAGRYLNDRFLPDKAIDIIDEAAASVKLATRKAVTVEDIENTIARMASIPAKSVAGDDRQRLAELESALAGSIYGQTRRLNNWPRRSKWVGQASRILTNPSDLFCSPVPQASVKPRSVGSWRILNLELIRFDMSEYMERHTVSQQSVHRRLRRLRPRWFTH